MKVFCPLPFPRIIFSREKFICFILLTCPKRCIRMDKEKWSRMPEEETIKDTIKAIKSRGVNVILVENREAALNKLKDIIPAGAEVMNGSSTTLDEIGFVELLSSGKHKWKNLHDDIFKEKNQEKQSDLRRKSVTADYFLGSVNAIAKTGQLVACDASGSRVTAYPFAAKNVVLVAGVQKIVPTLNDALKRIKEYAYPLEDKRARKAYGMGSTVGKCVIIEREIFQGRTTLILVKEKLGF